MSFFYESWNLQKQRKETDITSALIDYYQLSSKAAQQSFFKSSKMSDLYEGSLLKGYDSALQRIFIAIQQKERIVIFGDYDVDGVVGTYLLFDILKKVGAQVSYRLPHREKDGYGLKKYFIQELSEKDVKLIITVDTGIAAFQEAEYAKEKGIDLIITDHHEIQGKIPQSKVIVNPKQPGCQYPDKNLCGAAVAYKLACGIAKKYLSKLQYESYVKEQLQVVAMATIADVVPLIGENRTIVKLGLEFLQQSEKINIKKMLSLAKVEPKELDEETIGFQIGPRLNASGRMSSAYLSLDFLLGKEEMAEKLEFLNEKRKNLVKKALQDIQVKENESIVIRSSEKWHPGIIGLISGQITEKYFKPTIILQEQDDILVASCRAPKGFNIFDFLCNFAKMFVHFGGHAQAAGFSIEKSKYDLFIKQAQNKAQSILQKSPIKKVLEIVTEITEEELRLDTYDVIKIFSPFGEGHKKPVFLLKNVQGINWYSMGKENEHLSGRLQLSNGGNVKVIKFFAKDLIPHLVSEKSYDLAVTLEKNVWQGQSYLQLNLVDIVEKD